MLYEKPTSVTAIAKRVQRSRDCINRYLTDRQKYVKIIENPRISKIYSTDTLWFVRKGSKSEICIAHLKYQLELPTEEREIQQILPSTEHLQFKKFKKASPLTSFNIEAKLSTPRKQHAYRM